MFDHTKADILDYYTTRHREDHRLDGRPQGRLERIRTEELLRELLPPAPARILDVGGGPGVYARMLAGLGHRVRLLDLVPVHVEQARAGWPALEADVADARSLPEPDGGYDATLLLGPLYHLTRRDDRIAALAEAVRVTRPGGPVLAAAISRFAGPMHFAATGRLAGAAVAETEQLRVDGVNDTRLGFTHAYFHRVAELVEECRVVGLADVVVHGIEGPAWTAAEAAADTPQADAVLAGALNLARVVSSEPELVGASGHLLAVGTVRG